MGGKAIERRMLGLLAEILGYPGADLLKRIEECQALASARDPQVAALLDSFRDFVKATPQGRLEEVYTGTFDLDAVCHPYVGYHLFGESYERSAFLLGLRERYRAQGYTADERELPDRLSVMLGFLSASADEAMSRELIQEALLPALGKMTEGSQGADDEPRDAIQPYHNVLLALQMLLRELQPASVPEQKTAYAGGGADD